MFKSANSPHRVNPAFVTWIEVDIINERVRYFAHLVGGERVMLPNEAAADALELAVDEYQLMMAPKSSVL